MVYAKLGSTEVWVGLRIGECGVDVGCVGLASTHAGCGPGAGDSMQEASSKQNDTSLHGTFVVCLMERRQACLDSDFLDVSSVSVSLVTCTEYTICLS